MGRTAKFTLARFVHSARERGQPAWPRPSENDFTKAATSGASVKVNVDLRAVIATPVSCAAVSRQAGDWGVAQAGQGPKRHAAHHEGSSRVIVLDCTSNITDNLSILTI